MHAELESIMKIQVNFAQGHWTSRHLASVAITIYNLFIIDSHNEIILWSDNFLIDL